MKKGMTFHQTLFHQRVHGLGGGAREKVVDYRCKVQSNLFANEFLE